MALRPSRRNGDRRLVGQERFVDPETLARAVCLMEEFVGQKLTAIMAVSIGSGNVFSPSWLPRIRTFPLSMRMPIA
jgi:DUF917 family protein